MRDRKKITLTPQFDDAKCYLESSAIVDFGHENSREIAELSFEIAAHSKDEIAFVQNAYEYVRDHIAHSADINGQQVTCKASEVLRAREGICFAKSHLLAAILRCNSIPTGLCYQRLLLDDLTAPYLILHGLNAVYIEKINRWIRVDARGNKPGVDAQFSLDREKLAFPVREEKGEEDIPIIFARPDKNVLSALTNSKSVTDLWDNLPRELS
ncbi:transglutaminase [Clostridia bacterium]|nr:transglutaminase [Clostridia bacterium]